MMGKKEACRGLNEAMLFCHVEYPGTAVGLASIFVCYTQHKFNFYPDH